jgi:hypothetical protein
MRPADQRHWTTIGTEHLVTKEDVLRIVRAELPQMIKELLTPIAIDGHLAAANTAEVINAKLAACAPAIVESAVRQARSEFASAEETTTQD